jgi:DNA-binding NtrC family response regulator
MRAAVVNRNCGHLGTSNFLVKPVELRKLFAASQRCLDQLQLQQEL